nr:PqqD family protein [uncultured Sphingomonas sp.]
MRDGPDDPMVNRTGSLMEAEVHGEMVALHVESGTCFAFNGTAYRVWQLSARPLRLSELCAALGDEFHVDSATCEGDVRDLLAELSRDGLMTLS